jgi:hypothetical protein
LRLLQFLAINSGSGFTSNAGSGFNESVTTTLLSF